MFYTRKHSTRSRPSTNDENSGLVLEKVCEYFYYNEKHKNSKDVPDIDVPAELCLELLMAADYLNGEFLHSHHMSSCGAVCFQTRLCLRFLGEIES